MSFQNRSTGLLEKYAPNGRRRTSSSRGAGRAERPVSSASASHSSTETPDRGQEGSSHACSEVAPPPRKQAPLEGVACEVEAAPCGSCTWNVVPAFYKPSR